MACHICLSQSLMARPSITPAHGCMAKHVNLCHEGNKLSASRTLLVSLEVLPHPRLIISVLPSTTMPEWYKSYMHVDAGVS